MNLLSFDTETHLIQPGLLAPPIVCGSFAGGKYKSRPTIVTKPYAVAVLQATLDSTVRETICGANIAYDFACVLAERPDLFPLIWKAYEEGRVHDVQIAASLNAIAEGRMRDGDLFRRNGEKIQSGRYSLDECVKEWLGRDNAKENARWRLSYALLEHLPIEQWPEDARKYPIDDAVNTLEVAEAQLRPVTTSWSTSGAKNLGDLATQCHAAFCIHLGAVWGLRTDPERVATFKTDVTKHVDELRKFARESGLLKTKTKRPKADGTFDWSKDMAAIRKRVMEAYDGNPPTTAGTGAVSTSREALEDSGDPVLERFAEVGKWEKFNTYIPTLEEAAKKPLNVKPNVLLSTGRVSYEGLIQLMPRKGGVRECFVSRPGTLWSSVDYAAIEMSTLAQVCLWTVGASDLADAINAGQDPHCIIGADLLGCGYESLVKRYKAKEDAAVNIRQAGKAGNFGFPGMMAEAKFVIAQKKAGYSVCEWFFNDGRCGENRIFEYRDQPLEMPLCKRCVEQAREIRATYLKRWREVQKYWNWVMSRLRTDDAITQFVSLRVRGSPHGPAAANTLFQGLAADGAKRAVIQMTKEMYLGGDGLSALAYQEPDEAIASEAMSPLFGSRLVLFAHDETIIEIPEERAHDAAMRQAEVMVEQMKTCVPDVKVKAEPALMRRWYKGAEAVYDANGRLVPWEPK